MGSPTDPFEYQTGPPVDPREYWWQRALLQVCVVPAYPFWGWRGVKRTRPLPYPPVPVVARAAVGGGGGVVPTMPTRELYVQGTQEQQLPGIEPPHWTTEDYRSRYWAVYVSYPLCCITYLRGRSWGGRGGGNV